MTKVKICGITNKEDALLASNYGANYIGFIFYKKSPRYMTPEQALEVAKSIPEPVKNVGVFVNEQPARIIEITKRISLDIVQLHSVINKETYQELEKAEIPYLQVLRIKESLPKDNFAANKGCYGYLLDSYDEQAYGGTGKTFNWEVAGQFSENFKDNCKIFLSGGLNEDNVCEAIRVVKPYAVDVSSGIEKSAGKKDAPRMELFIRNAKECAQT